MEAIPSPAPTLSKEKKMEQSSSFRPPDASYSDLPQDELKQDSNAYKSGRRWFPIVMLIIGVLIVVAFGWYLNREYNMKQKGVSAKTAKASNELVCGNVKIPDCRSVLKDDLEMFAALQKRPGDPNLDCRGKARKAVKGDGSLAFNLCECVCSK